MSVLDWEIAKTPYVVIDIETTGLSPTRDRIVEIAAVVVRPGEPPKPALETLIHPGRPIGGTQVHGITNADVASAPRFGEIIAPLVATLSNRVVVSHNVQHGVAFLGEELLRHSYAAFFPHLCTMLLPRLVDPSAMQQSLRDACKHFGVEPPASPRVGDGAMATARLLRRLLQEIRQHKRRTFKELCDHAQRKYAFVDSLSLPPLPAPPSLLAGQRLRPRGRTKTNKRKRSNVARYLEAVLDVVADLRLEPEEEARITALRRELELPPDVVRAVHAKVFWGMLSRYIEDTRIDRDEASYLHRMRGMLSRLGWAPGDELSGP